MSSCTSISLTTQPETAEHLVDPNFVPVKLTEGQASYILPRLGQRYTVLLGISIVGLSLVMCSFSLHNIGGLMFLHGITFGFGGALVYLTSYTAPSQWFDKKRGLCTGIASCGAGLGGAVYSVVRRRAPDGQWANFMEEDRGARDEGWKLIVQVTERLMALWGPAWTYRFFGLVTIAIGAVSALPCSPLR